MVGPVLSALLRHLATSAAVENANAAHELETFGSFETFGVEAQDGWEGSMSSMPTPVLRNLTPSSLVWQLELGSLQHAGWHGRLGREDMNDDDEFEEYRALTQGGETAASIRRLQSLDNAMTIDLEDGFALPPPAVDLDESVIAASALDVSVVAAPHDGIPLTAPLAPPQGRQVALPRERFTLPAHVVKDEIAFPAASAAQPHRVRPSGCKAVRVGRRRVAVRSRREALPPRSKRRCQQCGSPP